MKKIFKHRFTKLLLILTLGIILMWQVVIPLLESSKTIFNILGIIVGGFSIVAIILHSAINLSEPPKTE
mgnify:CR=1 FL=1